MSAFELAKGFTNPVTSSPATCKVPDDVRDAHNKLQARRKLALILRSKATKEIPLSIGDLVEVYQKEQHEKRGKWSAAKPILSINKDARSVSVPGKTGNEVSAAIEDVRPAIPQKGFAQHVQDGIDTLNELLQETYNGLIESPNVEDGAQ